MARSAARRAVIRAEDRIENAMSDLEKEGGQVAVDTVKSWFGMEYLTQEEPKQEFAPGGVIGHPENGSDSVPAQLSPGEQPARKAAR